MILLEYDLRRSFAEQPEAAGRSVLDDSTHGLAYRVERVDLVDAFLGDLVSNSFVVLTEIEHEPEQRTLGLVADLLRQVTLALCRLHTTTDVICK